MDNQIIFLDTDISEDQLELVKKAGGLAVHKFGRIHLVDLQGNGRQVHDLITPLCQHTCRL